MEVGAKGPGQQQESVYFVTAVIYENPQKVYSLTSRQQTDCGDE
jgi:hypothetical protein